MLLWIGVCTTLDHAGVVSFHAASYEPVSSSLRAEMHLPEVSVRFGLMLEAYCRGCGSYMQDLNKQHHALDGMKQISQSLQKSSVSS